MRPSHLFVLATILSTALVAHADTISTFNLMGSSIFFGLAGDTNTVSGTLTIDVTTGVIQNISYTAGGVYESGVASQLGPIVYIGTSGSKISLDAGPLIGYMGSSFDLNGPNDLYVGHLTLASAVTPEPSSLLLLTTSLLGVVGIARRRLAVFARG